MPKSNTADSLQQTLNEIISSVLASQVTTSATAYSTSIIITQSATNSTNCVNYINNKSNDLFLANTKVFQSQEVLQQNLTEITNQLTSTIEQVIKGGLGGSTQSSDVKQLITNIVTNTLTADQLDINNSTTSGSSFITQNCLYSVDSVNVYIGTKHQISANYFQSYQDNSATQEVSTILNNYMTSQIKQKQVGLIASIVQLVALILIVIIICVSVGIVVYLITLLGPRFLGG